MDKKDYQQTLDAMRALATIDAIHRKLVKLSIATEDDQLKALLAPAIENLANTYRAAVSRKIAGQKVTTNEGMSPYRGLSIYCTDCLASTKPQWQILAERHGWAPQG
jgi:hypothetical protein